MNADLESSLPVIQDPQNGRGTESVMSQGIFKPPSDIIVPGISPSVKIESDTTKNEKPPAANKSKSKGIFRFFKRKNKTEESKARAAFESPKQALKRNSLNKSNTLDVRHVAAAPPPDNEKTKDNYQSDDKRTNSLPAFFRKMGFGRSSLGRKKLKEDGGEIKDKHPVAISVKDTAEQDRQAKATSLKKSNLRVLEIIAQNQAEAEKNSPERKIKNIKDDSVNKSEGRYFETGLVLTPPIIVNTEVGGVSLTELHRSADSNPVRDSRDASLHIITSELHDRVSVDSSNDRKEADVDHVFAVAIPNPTTDERADVIDTKV